MFSQMQTLDNSFIYKNVLLAWVYTFELSYNFSQVVIQVGVRGELQAHVILGDSTERLRGIDATLVQNTVDSECCQKETRSLTHNAR